MKVETKKTVTTTVRERIELSRESIVELLRATRQIPETAEVYFQVPGGADWSNESIDIDAENPVVIVWETKTEEYL